MTDLSGKVAVVTGGGSGIGLAAAAELARLGAQVVISGRDQGALERASQGLNGQVLAVQADVTDLADLEGLFRRAEDAFGKLDVLFVNAGLAVLKPLSETTEAEFDRVMDANFKGAYFTVQKALPHLKDGATVILNTSINAHIGMPGTTVYAASKAALSSLIRTVSAELLPRNIRVNAVSPGPVETPFFGKLGLDEAQLQAAAAGILGQVPLKRFGKPEEVAKLVTFLASDDAAFIVGTEVTVDGGMSKL